MQQSILIVDDQDFIRKVLSMELERRGYKTYMASDGVECIEKLRFDTKIDLVIMDVMMPNMDGYEACMLIRKKLKLLLPVVFLSANSMKSSIVKAIQSGGNDYIIKSPDNTALFDAVEKHLKNRNVY